VVVVNYSDAVANLEKEDYIEIKNLYLEIRAHEKTKYRVNKKEFRSLYCSLIERFNKISPFILYDGLNSINLDQVYIKNIYELYNQGFGYFEMCKELGKIDVLTSEGI